MSAAVLVTEVPARTGHRRWVYGAIAPTTQSRINEMVIRAINSDTMALGVGTFAEDYLAMLRDQVVDIWKRSDELAGFPVVIVPGMAGSAFVDLFKLSDEMRDRMIYGRWNDGDSSHRKITAAEYRAQGLHP